MKDSVGNPKGWVLGVDLFDVEILSHISKSDAYAAEPARDVSKIFDVTVLKPEELRDSGWWKRVSQHKGDTERDLQRVFDEMDEAKKYMNIAWEERDIKLFDEFRAKYVVLEARLKALHNGLKAKVGGPVWTPPEPQGEKKKKKPPVDPYVRYPVSAPSRRGD